MNKKEFAMLYLNVLQYRLSESRTFARLAFSKIAQKLGQSRGES